MHRPSLRSATAHTTTNEENREEQIRTRASQQRGSTIHSLAFWLRAPQMPRAINKEDPSPSGARLKATGSASFAPLVSVAKRMFGHYKVRSATSMRGQAHCCEQNNCNGVRSPSAYSRVRIGVDNKARTRKELWLNIVRHAPRKSRQHSRRKLAG